ncbi:MAG: bifunctional oligoribonuclease/PAP phosphatase NrnA [Chitinophagales bacterium]|nr:bifunctional oligoribonuclease/PAP phosphatase NrnA [Chitinophagales bacterium]
MSINNIKDKLSKAKSIVITTHVSPDGDAIGSSLGLYHFLKLKGIKSTVVVPNAFPNFLKWLPDSDKIVIFEEDENGKTLIQNADILFCLDYNEPHRTAKMEEAINKSTTYKILIDHHIGKPTWQNINLSVVGASSTCELVFDFIQNYDKSNFLNEDIAYCLYTGILTDTGNFQFSSTTPKVHNQAAQLMQAGVQPDIVHNHINNSFNLSRLQFFGYAISEKMKIVADKKLAYIILSQEDIYRFNIQTGGTEGLVNEPMKINDIEVSVLFKEDADKVKLSFRSKGDIDVSTFARTYFSGGGHKNAAGGVSFLNLEETEDKFLKDLIHF